MISDRWKTVIEQPGALPALPEVLIRLQGSLYELDVDIDQLCGELQCDPALVGEIIKTINSPLFAVSRRIHSLKQAVVLLGLRRLRAIILSQSLRQSLATYQSPGFSLFNWWDRSILSAIAATALCQRVAPELAEEAYLSGLIVDLGVLVLARFEPSYERLLRNHGRDSGELICELSRASLGTDHAELAADIFEHWRFPPIVVEAIRRHHDSRAVEDPSAHFLVPAIHFASLLTDCVVTERLELCQRLTNMAGRHLFMSADELSDFVGLCLGRYRTAARTMGHGSLLDCDVPAALSQPA